MAIKILIVDDEPEMERLMRQQFRRKLRKGAYECWFVQSGGDALNTLQEHPDLDVILCDINMPQMDGLTLLSKIQEREVMAKPVMVSAYGDMGNIRSAMNRGAFDFVVKPIDFDDLEITIEKAQQAAEKEKQAEATSQKLEVTEQELSETSAREQNLRELDELKNRFFTQISHEFRTPLTVILGMAEQIQEQPERWREKGLALIRQNGHNLLDLINQLLDLRKLEAGKLKANYVLGDVISYLQYLVASFESLAELNGISLSFESAIPELSMDHDPDKLLRIVTNLLSNAIKFTPDGGEVKLKVSGSGFQVSSEPTSQNSKSETKNLILTISDTGIGIPPEKIEHIFDSFYQINEGDSSTQGTGIGLTLTRELVRLMGGDIHAESEFGKGTVFSLHLPITQSAESLSKASGQTANKMNPSPFRLSQAATQLIAGKTQRVDELPNLLIIEDNADVTQYMIACLEGHYNLMTAKDGQEGIDLAMEHVPDLIISDLMMPHKNGYEVCKAIKKDEKTSHIPIILLTAKADQEARLAGFQQGADAYLAKPFDKQELMIRLEQLVKIRQQLQQRYQAANPSAPSADNSIQKEDAFIKKIQDILEAHIMDTAFGIQELCREIGMSRSQLHNKIKALTGRSTSLYIRFLRLSKARDLLKNSDLNVSEVAYQVGFNDPRYFSRTYIQEFGEQPSKMR